MTLNSQIMEEKEKQEKKLNEEIKIYNTIINEEVDNFQKEKNEEENEIYEERINSEVEKMVEFCEKVSGLFEKSSKPKKLILIDQQTQENDDIIVLKKKRKIDQLNDIFSEEVENNKASLDDIFEFDWKSKNFNSNNE